MAKANIKPFNIIDDKVAADFAYPIYEAYLKAKEAGDEKLIAQFAAAVKSLLKVELKLDPKTKTVKVYNGVMYIYIKFNVNNVYYDGWFRITEEMSLRGMADPANKQDRRNDHEGTRLVFETRLSTAGHFGRYLTAINAAWLMHINDMVATKVFMLGKRGIKPLLQTHFADTNLEKAGQPVDDPPIRLSLSKHKFPEKYPLEFLRGKPETELFDATQTYVDQLGNQRFISPSITQPDGKVVPVDWNNIHQFVKQGSTLMPRSIVNLPSASISQSWVAVSMILHRGIVTPPATYGGFDDDLVTAPLFTTTPTTTPTTIPADTTTPTGVLNNAVNTTTAPTVPSTASTTVVNDPASAPSLTASTMDMASLASLMESVSKI